MSEGSRRPELAPPQDEQREFMEMVYGEARWKSDMEDYIDSHLDVQEKGDGCED